jgi:hypothetical protein
VHQEAADFLSAVVAVVNPQVAEDYLEVANFLEMAQVDLLE